MKKANKIFIPVKGNFIRNKMEIHKKCDTEIYIYYLKMKKFYIFRL